MDAFIWVQCNDGSIQQVEEEVAMLCPVICRDMFQMGMGSSKNDAIVLPKVNSAIFSLILDYCRFHLVPGHSNKERKFFDEKFTKLNTKRLCELTSAADSLMLKPLVDLTSRALARMIEGKTPEEIRETFHLPDDLTEEEKLEPLNNANDDPRIRMLNRLYARRRKELNDRQKLKNVEVEEKREERSVDDLLSFINGDGDTKDGRALRKKKNRRRKDLLKDSPEPGNEFKVSCTKAACSSSSPTQAEDTFDSRVSLDDFDDGLDPLMKEELDREVEDFARRLNCDWPERMQELLSQSRERRHAPILTTGNCSNQRRFTGID